MNILWFGPVIKTDKVSVNNQQSPASNLWQMQQINALADLVNKIKVYSYIPLRSYPYGKLFSPVGKEYNPEMQENVCLNQIMYINIKYIREYTLAFKMIFSIILKKDYKENQIALFYNSSLHHRIISRFLRIFTNIKCIEIIADNYDSRSFDAHVYLSFGYYSSSIYDKKYFFDQPAFPMIDQVYDNKILDKKNITYAGALSKYGGITEFAKLFISICETTKELSELELTIVGHGTPDPLLIEMSNHKNINFYGFVSVEKLEEVLLLSDFFVNPRPMLDENKRNFPSKIITYLQYGKPVISSETEGLSPKYREILYFFDPDSNGSIESSLLDLISLKKDDLEIYRQKIISFTKMNNTQKMIKDFNKFLESMVDDKC